MVCLSDSHNNSIYFTSATLFSQLFLGNFPARRYNEEVPQGLISRFQSQLSGISGDIEERNKKLDVPYIYMLPSKIPNSITI